MDPIFKEQPIPRLKTQRLLLRPFQLYDSKNYFRLLSDPNVLHTTDMPHDMTESTVNEWILVHPELWRTRGDLYLLITHLSERYIIGAISLFMYDRHHKADIGYWISVSQWGKGYATEAASVMVQFAFETLKLNRLEANHLARNPNSGKVLQKIGFTKEGFHRKSYLKDDTYEDLVSYGQLSQDYFLRIQESKKAEGNNRQEK